MAQKQISNIPKLCTLLSTEPALRQHYLRAHLQTAYWKAACGPDAPDMDPRAFGWQVSTISNTFIPTKFPSKSLPVSDIIQNLISCSCASDCGGSCGCRKKTLQCTTFCACHGNCCNYPADASSHSSDESSAQDDEDDTDDDDKL